MESPSRSRFISLVVSVAVLLGGLAITAAEKASATDPLPVICYGTPVTGDGRQGNVVAVGTTSVPPGGKVRVSATAALVNPNSGIGANFYVDAQGLSGFLPISLNRNANPPITTASAVAEFENVNSGPVTPTWTFETQFDPLTFTVSFEPLFTPTQQDCMDSPGRLGGSNPSMPNACISSAADPIDTLTGNYWETDTDLEVPGRGPGLSLTRTYNSLAAAAAGPFGWGSSMSYGMRLAQAGTRTTIIQENGSQVVFSGGGPYTASPAVQATLVSSGTDKVFTRRGTERFTFDASGQLTRIEDLTAPGEATTLAYTGGQLTTVTDAAGRQLQFTWTNGRVEAVTQTTSPTRTVDYVYDPAGNLSDVIDIEGRNTHYTHDAAHRRTEIRTPRHVVDGKVVKNEYDNLGRVFRQTDRAGGIWSFDYTTIPGATKTTDPAGVVTVEHFSRGVCAKRIVGYGSADAATTTYTVDPASLAVIAVVDPNTNATGGTTPAVSFEYDTAGNPKKVTDRLGHSASATFTNDNLPKTATDGDGVVTTLEYEQDASGDSPLLKRASTPIYDLPGSPPTNPPMRVVEYRRTDPAHLSDVTQIIDPNNKAWSYTYNAKGDLTASTDPLGNKTTWSYNDIGWLISVTTAEGNKAGGNAALNTTTFSDFTNSGLWRTATDGQGRQTKRTFDEEQNLKTVTDAAGKATTIDYDAEGRATKITRPGGTTLQTQYRPDGAVAAQLDSSTGLTEYGYDPLGRLATEKIWTTATASKTTTFGYDRNGNLTSRKDPGGSCVAPVSNCVLYGYDLVDELTSINYSDATPDVTGATFDGSGRQRTLVAASGTSSWSYDSLGRLRSSATGAAATTYGYDPAGNVTSIGYPGNASHVVSRLFDAAGRIDTVTDWNGNTTDFDYDTEGRITAQKNPNGTTVTTGFDPAGGITSIDAAPNSAPASPFVSIDFTRDAVERITAETTLGLPEPKTLYAYDGADRIVGANNDDFAFDAAGNLNKLGALTQAFNRGHQLTSQTTPTGTRSFSYDDRGNRTAAGSDTFGFDQANRLTSANVSPDYARAVNANRPLGYWRLGEPSGTFAADSSGKGHEGTWAGSPTRSATGAVPNNGSATFGSTSWVRVGRPGEMTPVTPAMIVVATASGGSGQHPTPFAPGETATIDVTGVAGVPTSGVAAVVVSITAVSNSPGWVVAHASDASQPQTSTNNFVAGQAMNNQQTVRVGADGNIKIYNAHGTTEMWVSIVGYYGKGAVAGTGYQAVAPSFIYNTTANQGGGYMGAWETREVTVTGVGGVPATGVAAVNFNVTAIVPAANGYLDIWPAGTTAPNYSALNFTAGENIVNSVTAKVGTGGKIAVANVSGAGMHLAIEVLGWYGTGNESAYVPLNPTRRLDSRLAGQDYTTPWAAGETRSLQLTGTAGIPRSGVSAAIVNLTSANAAGYGYFDIRPADGSAASFDQIYYGGEAISNEVIVPLGEDGRVNITAFESSTHVILDVVGYFRTDPLFTLNNGFSVEFFAKTGSAGGIVRAGDQTTPNGWRITQNSAGTLSFTRNNLSVTTIGALNTSWRHVVFSYDGTTARWYLDGTLDKTQAVAFGTSKATSAITFGATTASLDEAAIYGRALSAGEVAAHRNAAIGVGQTSATYSYDGTGLRTSKTVAGSTTSFGWDQAQGLPLLLTETTSVGTTSFIYGPTGAPIAQVAPSGATSYLVADQLGSVRAMTDQAGAVTATFAYDAFGVRTAATGSTSTSFGFAGEYADAETGFVYLRARYLDPSTGQFLSRDPLEAVTGEAYGYAGGNPLSFTDPTGEFSRQDAANFFGGVLNAVTFGNGRRVLGALGMACKVDYGSGWFAAGEAVGTAVDVGGGALGAYRSIKAFKTIRAARVSYVRNVKTIRDQARVLMRLGVESEDAARFAVDARNAIKIDARRALPSLVRRMIERRNLARYGDRIGPNADDLLRTKTPEEVIDSAARTNEWLDRLLGVG